MQDVPFYSFEYPVCCALRRWLQRAICCLSLALPLPLHALTFALPESDALVGSVSTVSTNIEDTLMDVARANSIGINELRLANPTVDAWLPGEGTEVTIPAHFILPDARREGLVLNLSELRLYYYHRNPAGEKVVTTFPVGIGREDRRTPTGYGRVETKLENPTWYPTPKVRADYARRGLSLQSKVPPGPDNPLGKYALVLDLPGILLHGTNKPDGIGMLVSQGCIRLYPEHIEHLIREVPKGTPVTIVDQPYKAAVINGELVIEVHPQVYPQNHTVELSAEQRLMREIISVTSKADSQISGRIDWEQVREEVAKADGVPRVVSR